MPQTDDMGFICDYCGEDVAVGSPTSNDDGGTYCDDICAELAMAERDAAPMPDQPHCSCQERTHYWWEVDRDPDGTVWGGPGWRRNQIDLEDLTGTYCPGCGDKLLPGGQVERRAELVPHHLLFGTRSLLNTIRALAQHLIDETEFALRFLADVPQEDEPATDLADILRRVGELRGAAFTMGHDAITIERDVRRMQQREAETNG